MGEGMIVRILLILSLITEVMVLSAAAASLIFDSTSPTKGVFLRVEWFRAFVGQQQMDTYPINLFWRYDASRGQILENHLTFKVTTAINQHTASIT